MITQSRIEELKRFARQIRLETMKEFRALGFGHVGGSMSIITCWQFFMARSCTLILIVLSGKTEIG